MAAVMRVKFLSALVALFVLQTHWLASVSAAQFVETQDALSTGDGRFLTPVPPYPFLVDGDTHQWTARVAFNERGAATEAVLIRSTGSAQLDNTITRWIRTHWKSLGGKPATLVTSGK